MFKLTSHKPCVMVESGVRRLRPLANGVTVRRVRVGRSTAAASLLHGPGAPVEGVRHARGDKPSTPAATATNSTHVTQQITDA